MATKAAMEPNKRPRTSEDGANDAAAATLEAIFSDEEYKITSYPLLLLAIECAAPKRPPSGCLVTVRSTERVRGAASTDASDFAALWKIDKSKVDQKQTDEVIRWLLEATTDDLPTIAKSVQTMAAKKKEKGVSFLLMGEDDLQWWVGPDKILLRKFSVVNRIASPLYFRDASNPSQPLKRMPFSLLDVLLRKKETEKGAVRSTLFRIKQIHDIIDEKAMEETTKRLLSSLQSTLLNSVRKHGKYFVCDGPTPKELDLKGIKVSEITKLELDSIADPPSRMEAFSIPGEHRKEALIVREHRKIVRREKKEWIEAGKPRGRQITLISKNQKLAIPNRYMDGRILFTKQEISDEDFRRETAMMHSFNSTFPRLFDSKSSRPRFQGIHLSDDAFRRLKRLIFSPDGSLRNSIADDLDLTTRHGYITFSNSVCQAFRNDYRWQAPYKRHTSTFVTARGELESFLSEEGILDPTKEKVHDLGILIGGTEDQSLHHDISRQMTCWLPEENTDEGPIRMPIPGWEHDREAYNSIMESKYAPCSMLIGVGEKREVYIGVQRNQVERYGCKDGHCRVINGRKGEEFPIVRENEFLYVIRADTGGCTFTGDFPHAGTRNFADGSKEMELMEDLKKEIRSIIGDEGVEDDEHLDATKQVIRVLCGFKNLNKLCRLHCSTEPLDQSLRIPRNTIGFVDCKPNPPDVAFSEKTI